MKLIPIDSTISKKFGVEKGLYNQTIWNGTQFTVTVTPDGLNLYLGDPEDDNFAFTGLQVPFQCARILAESMETCHANTDILKRDYGLEFEGCFDFGTVDLDDEDEGKPLIIVARR